MEVKSTTRITRAVADLRVRRNVSGNPVKASRSAQALSVIWGGDGGKAKSATEAYQVFLSYWALRDLASRHGAAVPATRFVATTVLRAAARLITAIECHLLHQQGCLLGAVSAYR
jgi:hypothetical protein